MARRSKRARPATRPSAKKARAAASAARGRARGRKAWRAAAEPPPGEPAAEEPPRSFPVVAMGASAGGLEAFQKFFAAMPADSGMAFVLAQHLDPHHATLMPELLGRATAMPVEQVQDETPVQPDHVYVIPPNATLTVEGGILRVRTPRESGIPMTIDSLFHSVAEDQGHHAVCVLFSGAGSDGTLGLRAVKEHGGMAMAQTPDSAKHDSILRSAIATGMVDYVLPPGDMPAKLMEYAAYLRQTAQVASGFRQEAAEQLGRICALVRRRTGHDFSRYKESTVLRRIQRRMQVLQVPSVVGYVARLRYDAKEADQLFRDLLIGVTHFFRDPAAFDALAREVLPRIVANVGPEGSIRIWTPGCATGEEAYSVAMLVKEEMLARDSRAKVQIFAGDIDDEALEFARAGRYPRSVAEHIAPQRLERFFTRDDHTCQVTREIRDLVLFSTHNLIKDPPFSRVDLVVCRNLLIYLEADVQRLVTTLFHYALRQGGYLFLGSAESVLGPADLFSVVDKKHRIYQRNETVARPPLLFPLGGKVGHEPGRRGWTPRVATANQPDLVASLERLLLERYAPAWLVINNQAEAVYFSPRTGRYLEPAAGLPSMDVVSMARPGVRLELRTAIHGAIKKGEEVVREGIDVPVDGTVQRINLIVQPVTEPGTEPALFLVVFQEAGRSRRARNEGGVAGAAADAGVVQQLENELRTTKEHLQATLEEVETSNEELKSSNEELLSTNEELQSANEELQTSKEEMQSVNEELETINSQLNGKLEELDRVNSDLQNLLQSTQIPTLFLDNQFRIKLFTEAATRLFRLIASDVGRPITDIASRFEGDLLADLEEVRQTHVACERQVSGAGGDETYLLRVLPYRRVDGVVDGLVVTYTDVSPLNRALESQLRLAAIVASSQDAIVGRTLGGEITAWNEAATAMFGYSAEEAMGSSVTLIPTSLQQDELDRLSEELKKGRAVAPFESVRLTKAGRRLEVSVALSPVKDMGGRLIGSSAIFRDITELKRAQAALEEEARRKDAFLALLGHELRNPLAPLRNALGILRLREPGEERSGRALDIMDRQLAHLTSLVDQLLDASRISTGKIRLHPEEIDLVELVRMAVADQAALIEAAGLRLALDLHDRPVRVSGDRVRLAQVTSNLLSNATKFTERGGTVAVSVQPDGRGGSAVLRVRDTGVGIDPEMLGRIFTPFAQSAQSLDRTLGGLGLGLALVRSLVESHGGRVEARSEGKGKGATVTVRLPLAVASARVPAAGSRAVRPPGAPRRILIVENNEDAAETLRTLLDLSGHTVQVAGDGPSAVTTAASFRPDVVLCDIGLPGDMDGYAVAAAIRDADGGKPHLVALTGYGRPADVERAHREGFDRHLTKPADPDAIRRILDELPPSR